MRPRLPRVFFVRGRGQPELSPSIVSYYITRVGFGLAAHCSKPWPAGRRAGGRTDARTHARMHDRTVAGLTFEIGEDVLHYAQMAITFFSPKVRACMGLARST